MRNYQTRPVPNNIKLSSKCNFPGAGRPLTYPVELDDELLTWILALWDICFEFSRESKACYTT